MHKRAQPAAEAARCAGDQGKFWEYHDKLFANARELEDEHLKKYAADLSLNTEQFDQCYASGKFRKEVQADAQKAAVWGVTGTPAFFVNGRFLSGAQAFEAFKAIIDEELERP
jgi:protein-disulfide isomerase